MSFETASCRPDDIGAYGREPAGAAIIPVTYDNGLHASGTYETGTPASAAPHGYSRYSDQPTDWRTRLVGLSATIVVILTLVASLFITWRAMQPRIAAQTPLVVVNLQSLAAPPEPVMEVPEGPAQIEQNEQKPREEDRPEFPQILVPKVSAPAQPSTPTEPAQVAKAIPKTTAPKSLPAPPAEHVASDTALTWEAQLLAHLEKYRRYPGTARVRRVQGVAYVKFSMNRQGRVLSIRLVRSSGSILLDRAALETIRRAQPLPAIPDDRPDVLELSVPVEFFVHR